MRKTNPPVVQTVPSVAASPVEVRTAPAIDRHAQVIVLGYHRFVERVKHPDTEITPAEFEAQMQALKDQGIAVISLDDFLAWRREEKSIPSRSALITIDDGYNVAYSVAWPILKKFGYPFTMFVYTGYIRGGPKSGGGSISWEQLAEMRDAGVAIESHTISHPNLRGTRKTQQDGHYDEWLRNELEGSKNMIETRLGIKVTALALPYGLGNGTVREFAKEAGYEMVFTVNGVKDSFETSMDALGRYMVQANQPKLFTNAITFEGSDGTPAAGAISIAAQAFSAIPEDGAIVSDSHPLIQANLGSICPIDEGSVTIRISGVGKVAAHVDSQTKIVSCQTRDIQPDKYTVILGAKSQGKKFESRWSFTVESSGDAPAVAAGARPFVFGEKRAGPQKVNVGPIPGELFYRLFKTRDGAALNTEDVEEGIPKRFGLRVFTRLVFPVL